MWDINNQNDPADTRRPDLVIREKENKKYQVIDFTVSYDEKANISCVEKITKC